MRKSSPKASDSVVDAAVAELKAQLETALFLGTAMGCFVYTDIEATWEQLQVNATDGGRLLPVQAGPAATWLETITFPLEVSPETLLEVRHTGRLGSMRGALRRLCKTLPNSEPRVADWLGDEAQKMSREWGGIPSTMRFAASLSLAVPVGGFGRNDVRRLLLTFGRAKGIRTIPFGLFVSRHQLSGN